MPKVSRAGPAGGNQGAGFWMIAQLNYRATPPVTGALGVIGLSGRASQETTGKDLLTLGKDRFI